MALNQLRLLEKGRVADLRTSFELDVDNGLMWWDQLESFPLHGAINVLSGHSVLPNYERFVRRIAACRRSHASPLRDPALTERMLRDLRARDPAFAAEIEAGGRESDAAIDRMVAKYGQ